MKKVGIVADNYKVEKFKKESSAKGFTVETTPFTKDTTTMTINIDESQIGEIKKICQLVEIHFKRSN